MEKIDVFLSRPTWVPHHIDKQFAQFYPFLAGQGFNAKTIGTNVVPLESPFQDVVSLINQCSCSIILGLPQIHVESGKIHGKEITKDIFLPTEWNQIEAAISIMLKKPTLMLLHEGVANRGLFDRGAANIFVHEFHSMGHKWLEEMEPMLQALRERIRQTGGNSGRT